MFLIGYSSGTLRVVIHTANLLYGDIHIKTQGGYIQDFQRKAHSQLDTDVHRTPPNSRHKATSQFEDDLVSYIDSYRYTGEQMWESSSLKRHTLADQIRLHDFSCARGILIPSIPGRHNVQRAEFGYLKLNRVISHHIGKPQRGDNVSNTKQKGPLIAQCSSLGSLTQKWLNEFTSSLGGNEARHLDSTKLDSSKLKIVWPTVDEIRDSVEGYLGGGSVPGTTKNVSKDFLQPLYHRWGSTENPFNRSFTVPHIKTYMQLSEDESSIEWFVLSSHNLSKAAWGEVQNGKFGKCLFMRHWELGVLFLPGMFSKIGPNGKCNMKTFQPYSGHTIGKNAIPLPLPYCLPPKPYRPKDVPWAVDKEYPAPDSFSRRGLI
jgi:tyrosyl-DNA phosphodiesterase-1